MNIFFYIILGLISFFPIVIWAYSFSFISDNILNKKRFLFGILWGSLSIFPILYMDKIIDFFNFKYLNIFLFVSEIKNFFSVPEIFLSLSLFLAFIIIVSFLFWGFLLRKKWILKIYLKNFLVFLVFILFLSFLIFILNFLLQKVDFVVQDTKTFKNIIFDTFKLITFYYIIVAFVEETSKHFNFLQSSALEIKSIKSWVESAIFVALWFSFIENILYLYNYFSIYNLDFWLVKLYFFRSVFSVLVHVLCSSIVWYYFSKAILLYREKDLSFPYLKIFSFGILVSIFLHLFFDLSLTLGFSFILFIYFIWAYLYVSSIFYKE